MFTRHAPLLFTGNERTQLLFTAANPRFILPGEKIHGRDVIPGGHDHTAIDGHRLARCMGKDKAHRLVHRQLQFRHDGLEVMAAGPQAVQPDHAELGRGRSDLDTVKQWGTHTNSMSSPACSLQ